MNPSMLFLALPVLKDLVCVSVTLQQEDEDLRSTRIKTCRELVLLYSDILASPALDSFSDITVITSLGCPQCVSPGVLQCCLSYSLITRLAPSWNKAGLYLVSGKDFLTESGRLNAVGMELSTSEGQLCLSIEANTVRLPPTRLEDFDLPPLVLRRFCSDPDSVVDPSSSGGALWCHVLPSMKKGQIITVTRQLPRDGPFRTYRDLQDHWNHLYGYRLPDAAEEEVVYCSVYFRLVGERLFTYPLSCVRLQPVQRCPRVDPQGALGSFLSDVGARLNGVCGFPARLTGRPRHHAVGLSAAATLQVFGGEQINLSTSSSSIRPVLTQLPPPRPVKPYFGSQPPAWTPFTQQDGAQGLLGNSLTQSQGCRGDPSSSSSSSFSSLFQTASSLSSSSSSSSSVLPPLPPPPPIFAPKLVPIFKNKCPLRHINVAVLRLQKQREQLIGGGEERGRVTLPAFRMKTSTTTTASSSSSVSSLSVASLTLPPPFNRRPKAAPQPAGHIGLKRITSLSPASESRPGFLLAPQPETTKSKTSSKTSVKSSSDTNTSNKRPPPSDISNKHSPPSDISFKHPPPSDISNKHSPPSDISNKRPPPSDISFKHPPPSDISFKHPPPSDISFKRPPAAPPSDISNKRPPAAPPSDASFKDSSSSSRRRVVFEELKPKKPRSSIRDVDVEQMARSNQLSKVNSSTLLSWLEERGVLIRTKHRKEDLMLKVMGCLAEA